MSRENSAQAANSLKRKRLERHGVGVNVSSRADTAIMETT